MYLSFYAEIEEPIFATSSANILRILIDIDNNPESGFMGPGIGADYLLEISGQNQAIVVSNLYVFDDGNEITKGDNTFLGRLPLEL